MANYNKVLQPMAQANKRYVKAYIFGMVFILAALASALIPFAVPSIDKSIATLIPPVFLAPGLFMLAFGKVRQKH